jgi:hypothetical protein
VRPDWTDHRDDEQGDADHEGSSDSRKPWDPSADGQAAVPRNASSAI